jgi:hypothetical protein
MVMTKLTDVLEGLDQLVDAVPLREKYDLSRASFFLAILNPGRTLVDLAI